jgi:hypothetical protein
MLELIGVDRGFATSAEHRKRFAGEDHLVVVQPDGTLALIPAWMSEDNARSATLTASRSLQHLLAVVTELSDGEHVTIKCGAAMMGRGQRRLVGWAEKRRTGRWPNAATHVFMQPVLALPPGGV